jgi:hypothetical protein
MFEVLCTDEALARPDDSASNSRLGCLMEVASASAFAAASRSAVGGGETLNNSADAATVCWPVARDFTEMRLVGRGILEVHLGRRYLTESLFDIAHDAPNGVQIMIVATSVGAHGGFYRRILGS